MRRIESRLARLEQQNRPSKPSISIIWVDAETGEQYPAPTVSPSQLDGRLDYRLLLDTRK